MGKDYTHMNNEPESKVHGAIIGPTWVLSAPDGPHEGPMNLAIRRGAILRRSPTSTLGLLSHS